MVLIGNAKCQIIGGRLSLVSLIRVSLFKVDLTKGRLFQPRKYPASIRYRFDGLKRLRIAETRNQLVK